MILEAASFEVRPARCRHFIDPGKQVCSLFIRDECWDVMYVILLRRVAMRRHMSAKSAPLVDFSTIGKLPFAVGCHLELVTHCFVLRQVDLRSPSKRKIHGAVGAVLPRQPAFERRLPWDVLWLGGRLADGFSRRPEQHLPLLLRHHSRKVDRGRHTVTARRQQRQHKPQKEPRRCGAEDRRGS